MMNLFIQRSLSSLSKRFRPSDSSLVSNLSFLLLFLISAPSPSTPTMPRRHSICLSDINSLADSVEQSYPQISKYKDPDEDSTIWAFRKPSTPTMTITTESASVTPAKPSTSTTTAENNKQEQQPQDPPQTTSAKKKKKNKKKKPKSRTKGKDKLDQDQDQTEGSIVETETESLAQLIQPMPLGTPTPFIVNSASWHKVDEVCLLLVLERDLWVLTPSGQE